jgi:hypothetical protein
VLQPRKPGDYCPNGQRFPAREDTGWNRLKRNLAAREIHSHEMVRKRFEVTVTGFAEGAVFEKSDLNNEEDQLEASE